MEGLYHEHWRMVAPKTYIAYRLFNTQASDLLCIIMRYRSTRMLMAATWRVYHGTIYLECPHVAKRERERERDVACFHCPAWVASGCSVAKVLDLLIIHHTRYPNTASQLQVPFPLAIVTIIYTWLALCGLGHHSPCAVWCSSNEQGT